MRTGDENVSVDLRFQIPNFFITTVMRALSVSRQFVKMAVRFGVGCKINEIETPALLVDLNKLERNLRRMPASLNDVKVAVRPHAKAHKCPAIGRMQVCLYFAGVQ